MAPKKKMGDLKNKAVTGKKASIIKGGMKKPAGTTIKGGGGKDSIDNF